MTLKLQQQCPMLRTPAPCFPIRHSLVKAKAATAPLPQQHPSASARRAVSYSESREVARCSPRGAAEPSVQNKLSVSVPTAEARSSLRFQLLRTGTGQAVVVSAVAEGSSAEQAGVQRGMKLTAISDPIRRDEVWELQDRPSLRYIRDVMRMRSAPFIDLCFESDAELTDALDASEGSISMTNSSSGSSTSAASSSFDSISSLASTGDSGDTVAERLQQQYERAQAAANTQTALEQRQQRRKDYMEQAGQRNDNAFIAIMGAAFLLPAVVILLVAYFSGYLDNLYSNSLTNMR